MVCGLVVGAAVLVVAANDAKPEAGTARDILDRTARAYADCKSYRDSGVVKTVFFQATGKRTVNKPFTTAFVRPDCFRFEYTEKRGEEADEVNRYIIWRNGGEVRTWWDIRPGVETPASLGRALGAAAGVSGASLTAVPSLLFPKEAGSLLTFLPGAKRLEDAKLGTAECFRVEGAWGNSPRTLWVDQKTLLVRRIDTRKEFDAFRTEDTTTYDPVFDEDVPDKKLEFDPPKQK